MLALPSSPGALAKARWEDIVPYFDDLAERPLDETTIEGWLQAWSTLEELVTEAAALAMIAYTIDTSDPEKEADHLRFSTEILPKMEERSVELARRLVELGLPHAGARDHAGPLPHLDRDLPRGQRADLLGAGGAERAVPADHRLDDGGVGGAGAPAAPAPAVPQEPRPRGAGARLPRRRAVPTSTSATSWPGCSTGCTSCGSGRPGTRASPTSATTSSRRSSASTTPRPTASASTTPIEQTVAPAVERMLAVRRQRLSLDVLRPWDLAVDPVPHRRRSGPSPTTEEFVGRARAVFDQVDPALGAEFQTMIDERLLDLDSRKGKAPGGYCETLHHRGRPFIFMNAVGLVDDVMTLLHEAGHAFHAFASHEQPLIWQRHPGLGGGGAGVDVHGAARRAAIWRSRSGTSPPEDHRSAWLEHLEDILLSLVAHRVGGRLPDLDLHQRRGRRCGGAGRGLAPDSAAVRARRGLERARAGAGGALVPPAPHLHVSVLLHRIRHRADRRAPGLAQQPAGSRRRGRSLPRGARARRGARPSGDLPDGRARS